MRPIDADALTEDFKGRIKPCDKWIKEANEETKPRAEATREFINEVILTIQDAPTIEPDRPRGEWAKEYLQIDEHHFRSYAKCKVCGCSFKPYSFAVKEFDFCPKCGADMRKEGDENG